MIVKKKNYQEKNRWMVIALLALSVARCPVYLVDSATGQPGDAKRTAATGEVGGPIG